MKEIEPRTRVFEGFRGGEGGQGPVLSCLAWPSWFFVIPNCSQPPRFKPNVLTATHLSRLQLSPGTPLRFT